MRRSTVVTMVVVTTLGFAGVMATSATASGHRGGGFHGGGAFHGSPGPGFPGGGFHGAPGFRGAAPAQGFMAPGSGFRAAPPAQRFMAAPASGFMAPPAPGFTAPGSGFHGAPPGQRFMAPPAAGFNGAARTQAAPGSLAAPGFHGAAPGPGSLPAASGFRGDPGTRGAAPGFHGATSSSRVATSSTAVARSTATSVTNVTINNRFFDGLAFPRFHHHVFVDFFFFGGPVFAGPWFGFWDPFWFPPPVVIQESPPVYVQQSPAPTYWYYCADAKAYYPYVQECPGGWLTVVPTL